MAAKINWHRYGTKLRHCHPMYTERQSKVVVAARRYASAAFAVVCTSVCPPQADIASKRLDRLSWFWHGGFSPLILHCVVGNSSTCVSKVRVLPSRTLSETLDLDNFATARRSCCQQKSSTVELVDHAYDGRRVWLDSYSSLHVHRL